MNDEQSSGNRWEPDTPTSTAVQEPPPVDTAPSPPVPERHGLQDRWRSAPPGARSGALTAAAVVLLLGVGLGGFAIGRATADDGPDPTRFDPGGRIGDRPDGDGDRGPGVDQDGGPGFSDQDGDQDFGQGTDPGTGSDSESGTTQSSWYVVPSSGSGPSAA